jgi:hypothetical protein
MNAFERLHRQISGVEWRPPFGMNMPNIRLIGPTGMAHLFNCCPTTIRNRLAQGKLPPPVTWHPLYWDYPAVLEWIYDNRPGAIKK